MNLKENFVNIQDIKSDLDILRLSMTAELDASSLYEVLAKKAISPKLKKTLLDISYEEKVHVGEFKALLNELDPDNEKAYKEGENEVIKLNKKEESISIRDYINNSYVK